MTLDEISTGLDSAATYDITNTLRKAARILGATVVVSLLQVRLSEIASDCF